MKIARYLSVIIVLGAIGTLAFIRFAPVNVDRWHVPVTASTSRDLPNGSIRVTKTDPQALARADAAVRALPRTKVLAGSVDEGRITYVTRSAMFGFPDYTTIEYSDGLLRMYSRARFGSSDFGVNRARLERLLVAAKG
jgi:uncharacterized protein DUF1499